ncbi:ATP-dependent DNA helicase RecG [Catonella morbi ATCC 51271]|uniref:ATP-dependent DNA helicase RecG n=1 Tax=Catonella morbi ATCC 51271 TaxID=592026 RepID=V2YAP9_9FIRM|nr:ATP-dependent DNA helicase RecG [Catonella morbi]ESL04736.1 ATP-dependent DNA helicase RecG [Catonella morbi ATCC 51271]
MVLEESITAIKGIGNKTAALLNKLGIYTKRDIIKYFPRNYDKYEKITPISSLKNGMTAVISAIPASAPILKQMGKKSILICEVTDGSGKIELNWFNMPFMKTKLSKGVHNIFRGRVSRNGKFIRIVQPEILTEAEYRRKTEVLQPIYRLTKGVTSNLLRKSIKEVLVEVISGIDYLPQNIKKDNSLISLKDALQEIHFPKSYDTLIEARRRLVFDEFFLFALSIDRLKQGREENGSSYVVEKSSTTVDFISSLPFSLTNAQQKVWEEIENDLTSGFRMNRLVQGDVGSGKTLLAILACLLMTKNGYQSSVMVPTEVLARQHFESFSTMLEQYGIRVVLLTGSVKGRERKETLSRIENHEADIIIGTHALIQEKVVYDKLALVITDEQHRFGVKQREKLADKGIEPHIMVMSATPIPRTLAVILYGDLDISIVNELPADRLPIKNCVVDEDYRMTAYKFILSEVNKGHQAYIICPMVEKSEENDELSDVISYTEELTSLIGNKAKIKYLHGKMKNDEKNQIMEEFSDGRIDILISTTVVEVGVNVPNATVMMIENADRFGLASLHQLRGRIGRGNAQSYCIFMSGNTSKEAMERLNILNKSNDGFKIAEEDMKLRGPGDVFGIRQSGEMAFNLGDIIGDADILKITSETVKCMSDKIKNECYDRGRNFYSDGFVYGEDVMTL